VHWVEVQLRHLLEEVAAGWAGGYRHTDRMREPLSLLGRDEKRVDRRRGVEMCDALLLEEPPDQGVVDLSEADVQAADGDNGPWECPTDSMEPGER
jgi:hypothetical protein